MNNLGDRLRGFDGSLKDFKAETYPSWQTAEIFNALLSAAKQQYPDDPVVQAVSPAEEGTTAPGLMGKNISTMDVGSMRATVRQIRSLTGGLGPSIG
jgi:hypothetical protein